MIAHVGHLQGKALRQRTLNGKIPRFHVRLLEVLVHYRVRLARARRNQPSGQNTDARGGRNPGRHVGRATLQRRQRIAVGLRRVLVGTERVVECVLVVGEGRVADAEGAAQYCLLGKTIGQAKAWRDVVEVGFAA